MSVQREEGITELVIANRILAHLEVTDVFGHVSARDPDDPERYLLARSRAPEPVTAEDTAADVAAELVDQGTQSLELCGAFDPTVPAAVIEATNRRVPVGRPDPSCRARASEPLSRRGRSGFALPGGSRLAAARPSKRPSRPKELGA